MEPRYGRIARELREGIMRGDHPPGSKLPPLPELVATFGVSRGTVRDAIASLANEGLVTPRSGVGTVVRDLTTVNLDSSLENPHPVWTATAGDDAKAVVIAAEWASADQEISARLGLPSDDEIVHRVKHYYKGRDVVLTHEQWLPAEIALKIRTVSDHDVADKEATEPKDLYSLLRDVDHAPVESTETVTSRMPDPTEKEIMNIAPGIPVLLTMRATRDRQGKVLETSNFAGCADRTSQTYTVTIPDPQP